jgi:hypothetical protein
MKKTSKTISLPFSIEVQILQILQTCRQALPEDKHCEMMITALTEGAFTESMLRDVVGLVTNAKKHLEHTVEQGQSTLEQLSAELVKTSQEFTKEVKATEKELKKEAFIK